jgi:hypothetical protein
MQIGLEILMLDLIEKSLPVALSAEPLVVAIVFLGLVAMGLVWLLSIALGRLSGRK